MELRQASNSHDWNKKFRFSFFFRHDERMSYNYRILFEESVTIKQTESFSSRKEINSNFITKEIK